MQAAAISGLGLSVFALSTFTPTQRFGYLMLTILFAGLVAELIMLPALLAGPLGKYLCPRDRHAQQQDSSTAAEEADSSDAYPPAVLPIGSSACAPGSRHRHTQESHESKILRRHGSH